MDELGRVDRPILVLPSWLPAFLLVSLSVGPVIAFEALLREARPEESLLLSYTASLGHFEEHLLAGLQSRGAGEVTLLLDERGYEESLSEAAMLSGPGIRYQVHPVRLSGKVFHPKLYLLLSPRLATLVVASANLTIPGCRSNAEVADVLTLSPEGGDVRAFDGYLDLLDRLAALDPALSLAARRAIRSAAARVRALRPQGEASEGGPVLLHTADRPLLPQVIGLVPPRTVQRVTAVSPFFDMHSHAIRAVADAYPLAEVRVVKDASGSDDLNGAALRPLGERISVFALESLEGQSRRLHAKLVLFEGPDGISVLSGSANLSAPAWLHPAGEEGNLEAVVLRRGTGPEVLDRLLGNAVLERAGLEGLRYAREAPAGERPSLRLDLLDAMLEGAALRVRVRLHPPDAVPIGARIYLESLGDHAQKNAVLLPAEDGTLWLDSPAPDPLPGGGETPITVGVELDTSSGAWVLGRGWLNRPEMLRMSVQQRSLRRAVSSLTRRIWIEDGDAPALIALLSQFSAELTVRPRTRAGAGAEPQGEAPRLPGESTFGADDMVVSSAALFPAGGGPGSALHWIQELLARHDQIFQPRSHSSARAEARRWLLSGQEASEGQRDVFMDELDTPPPAVLSRRILDDLDAAFSRVAERGDLGLVSAERVPVVGGALFASLRLLVTVHRQQSRDGETETRFLRHLARMLWAAFSVQGAGMGDPVGWMVRAWLDPGAAGAVEAFRQDEDRTLRMALFAAFALARIGALPPPQGPGDRLLPGDATEIVAGVRLTLDPSLGGEDPSLHARGLAESLELGAEGRALLEALQAGRPPGSPSLESVRRWSRVCAAWHADPRSGEPPPEVCAAMAEVPGVASAYTRLRGRRSPPFAGIRMREGRATCEACWVDLPASDASRLRSGSGWTVCSSCGRILVPLSLTTSSTGAHLVPLLGPRTSAERAASP